MDRIELSTIAPAKINLYLELLARRDDGFHQLETVMSAVGLCDNVLIRRSGGSENEIKLVSGGRGRSSDFVSGIPSDERNLAWIALLELQKFVGLDKRSGQGAKITIIKRIPAAAGLGGASSNAAAVLRLGNQLYRLGLTQEQLSRLAARLGSDVPFFLNSSFAVCRGRGELVSPIASRTYPWFVILKPPEGFSTPLIYSHASVPKRPRSAERMIAGLQTGRLSEIAAAMFNRLEQAASEVSNWCVQIRDEFRRIQCLNHQLSGSGSCYFGIFPNRFLANRGANRLRSRMPGVGVFVCRSIDHRNIIKLQQKVQQLQRS